MGEHGALVALRLVMIALFVAAQVGQSGLVPPGSGLLPVGLSVVVAATLVAAPLPGTRRRPLTVAGIPVRLAITVLASIALLALAPNSPAIVILVVAAWVAPIRYPLARALVVESLILAGLVTLGLTDHDWDTEISVAVGSCVAFLASYAVQQRRATRMAEEREAVLAERARIAREIHDILAHSLSAQIVHLEGARLLLRGDRAQEALTRVERARDLAKTGLEEARRAVSALREDRVPLPAALAELAGEFHDATGLTCTLTVTGTERRLAPEAELAMIRTAQEALTNIRRHAPGAPAEVRLGFTDDACELAVTNPAAGGPADPGTGYGLMGMRERAALLNGTLEAGPASEGFQVRLSLPVAESGRSR
ncbi:two-component sensor histidine kinase [Microtetraspora sp. NBRC 13810]|uniref:sensor histidine kinase n=1 Tax=Microtetraspora sp. NBRC 13810 TaxID=3030990 RepID=UPI00249FA5BD|nr:sensor histidine kinase [Microtetraspora sp. NBRC 13810]GLW06862.1 two-component sensor histidine kinase [Microtetraspora sp. NBRC 13810]